MEEGEPGGGAGVAEDAMSRFSLDASAGGRHSTLLDEYERLAFEAQLNRAIVLRRRERRRGARFWRLHEVLARSLEALRPVLRWLRSAWERRRRKEPAADPARRPPPTVPRVQLIDYLR
ncbi:uncharacterized protein C2845_PM05G34440 [Panicum miliaceum]|uniref:Uncharacterized protein n=1 Tax=Panicum miliaceum TaxID=4540 RepID=A0A3L6T5L9_PANMI|nr:uncharacterized protein C2845_PM05G34440 [Panicum miliaceum]